MGCRLECRAVWGSHELARCHVSAFGEYLADQWDYVLRLPYAYTIIHDPCRRAACARALLSDTPSFASAAPELAARLDPLGLGKSESLRALLGTVASGKDLPLAPRQILAAVIGAFTPSNTPAGQDDNTIAKSLYTNNFKARPRRWTSSFASSMQGITGRRGWWSKYPMTTPP